MKRKTLTALFCLAITTSVFSQDSLSTSIQNKNLSTPLIVIKGEEIRRFPSNNFLDAVNGLYPWLFQQNPENARYTYVVDGNILLDINAISLHDIEEVSFSRSNLDGSLYPFSQAGVFYIKTKIADNSRKPVVRFNTQSSLSWNKEKSSLTTDVTNKESDRSTGYLQTGNLSVSMGNQKLQFYGSLIRNFYKTPGVRESGTISTFSIKNNSSSDYDGIGAFVRLTYQFSSTVTGGISANYLHGSIKSKYDQLVNNSSSDEESYSYGNAKNKLNNYHIAPYITWAPTDRLRNTFTFEYAGNELKYKSLSGLTHSFGGPPTYTQRGQFDAVPSLKSLLIRDHLEYDLSKGKFKSSIGAILSHLNRKVRNKQEIYIIENDVDVSASMSFMKETQKITTINPLFHFSYNALSGYIGHTFLLNDDAFPTEITSKSKHGYYGGAILNIQHLLKSQTKTQRLDLAFHYGDLTRNTSDNYWLPGSSYPGIIDLSVPFYGVVTSFTPGGTKQRLLRTKLISLQLNASFLNGKLLAGAEWSQLKEEGLYAVPTPFGSTYVPGTATVKGISLYGAGKIINKENKEWTIRFNVLLPDHNYKLDNNAPFYTIEAHYGIQAGLQNYFRSGRLYGQLNGLAGLDRKLYDYTLPDPERPGSSTDIILNYIMIGYDLREMPKVFSKLGIFFHARNLLGSSRAKEYYTYDSYLGAGIHLQMN